MAEINTDIYKPQPQQNPLDMLTKIGSAASGLGDLEVGKAMQQALKEDGSVDVNMLSGLLKQTPVGAMKAVPTLDAIQKLRQAGFSADQSGLETFQKRMAITHHLFSGLASKEKPNMDDVYDIASKVLDPALEAKKYGITLPVIMNAIKQFRGKDGKPLPPEDIKKKALEIQTQAASTMEVLEQHSPRMEAIDRGGNIEFVPTGSRAAPAAGTVVPKNLSPSTPVAGEEGGQLVGEQPAPAPAAVRPGGQPAVAPPVIPRGPQSSLPPGYSEGATASAKSFADAKTRSATYTTDIFPLKEALTSLKKLGKEGTGPMTDEINNFKSFLQSAGATWLPGLNYDSITDYDKAKKYLVQAAQSRAGNFGSHTDQQLSTTLSANPSTRISNLAGVELTKAAIGLRNMEQAMALEAIREGVTDAKFTKWAAQWANKQDPRAYMIEELDKEQLHRLVTSLKPADRVKFNNSMATAIRHGIIQDPNKEAQ